MNKFLLAASVIWKGVRESLLSWTIVIVVLALLLAAFKCYTSPVKLAKKKLKKIEERISSFLPGRKNKIALDTVLSDKDWKEFLKDAEYTKKMLQAYWYDNSDDIKIKSSIQTMRKMMASINASEQGSLRADPKAMGYLMKNLLAQTESVEKILKDY